MHQNRTTQSNPCVKVKVSISMDIKDLHPNINSREFIARKLTQAHGAKARQMSNKELIEAYLENVFGAANYLHDSYYVKTERARREELMVKDPIKERKLLIDIYKISSMAADLQNMGRNASMEEMYARLLEVKRDASSKGTTKSQC